jgi:hypothetical protein
VIESEVEAALDPADDVAWRMLPIGTFEPSTEAE